MEASDVMLSFEALGDNCEFGLVQRQAGVEPLGLLRFAGFHVSVEQRLGCLIDALDAKFEGLGDFSKVRVQLGGSEGRREFLLYEDSWNLMYHTFQGPGQVDSETLRAQEAQKLQFLRRKFLADLGSGRKMLVWKSNLPANQAEVERLVGRLRTFGPNLLLWVVQAEGSHTPGSVQALSNGLIKGYVERFAPYNNATDIDHKSWFRLCEEAVRLTRAMA